MTLPLIICIVLCVAAFVVGTIVLSRKIKDEKKKEVVLLIASLGTVVCHYSSILYHLIGHAISPDKIGTVEAFLRSNPNLILPIYPCNFVMWGLLILSISLILSKNKQSKFNLVLIDFLFLFGIVSGIAGMLANGDYFNPRVVKNYDIYKSCVAHAFMILNILLLPAFGYFKLDTLKNLFRTTIGVLAMGIDGLYCSVVAWIVNNEARVMKYNSMFLFKSPFEGLPIVRFHIIMPLFLVLLFGVLTLVEVIKFKPGNRWWNKIKKVNN